LCITHDPWKGESKMDWQLPAEVTQWIRSLANLLDKRNAFRLLRIFNEERLIVV
jgi:hypothetical protein